MNKKLIVLALTLLCVSAFPYKAYAADEPEHGISLEVGADLVSSYLWRGYNLGGLSIQPSVCTIGGLWPVLLHTGDPCRIQRFASDLYPVEPAEPEDERLRCSRFGNCT